MEVVGISQMPQPSSHAMDVPSHRESHKPGQLISHHLESAVVLATGPGNPPAVRVWTAKTDGSVPDQFHNLTR